MLQRFIVTAACVCAVIGPLYANDAKQPQNLIKGQTYLLKRNQANYVDFNERMGLAPRSVVCPPVPSAVVFPPPTQNPNALPGAFYPNPSASNQLIAPPQTIGVVFSAGRSGDDPTFPVIAPDTNGVKGKTQYMKGDSTGIITFNDEGERQHFVDALPQSFANLDLDFSTTEDNFAARVRYDTTSDRFFSVNLLGNLYGTLINNGVNITFSNSGTLGDSTTWSGLSIFNASVVPDSDGCPGDTDLQYDYPCMAIDKNAVYITFNMLSDDGFVGSTLLVIQKESLLGDGPVVVTAFRDLPVITLQPAMNSAHNPEFGFAIGSDLFLEGKLQFLRVVDAGSDSPSITALIPLDVLATAPASPSVPESGMEYQDNVYDFTGRLTYGDSDQLLEAHVANNQLYTAEHILTDLTGVADFAGDRISSRWYQFDVSGSLNSVPTLVQAGTLFDPSVTDPLYYLFPAIMTNKRGDLSICTSVSGKNQSVSAGYVGRLVADPLGTLRIGTVPPSVYAVGSDPWTMGLFAASLGQLWGHVSYTNLDPADRMTMWTIQEIAVNGGVETVVARLDAP